MNQISLKVTNKEPPMRGRKLPFETLLQLAQIQTQIRSEIDRYAETLQCEQYKEALNKFLLLTLDKRKGRFKDDKEYAEKAALIFLEHQVSDTLITEFVEVIYSILNKSD